MENEYVMKQAMNVSYQRSVLYILWSLQYPIVIFETYTYTYSHQHFTSEYPSAPKSLQLFSQENAEILESAVSTVKAIY